MYSICILWKDKHSPCWLPISHYSNDDDISSLFLDFFRHKARYNDTALFPTDVEHFIEILTVHKPKKYIEMNEAVTFKSMKKTGEAINKNTQPIFRWLKPIWGKSRTLLQRWKWNKLIQHTYSKKRKCRWRLVLLSNQPRLMKIDTLKNDNKITNVHGALLARFAAVLWLKLADKPVAILYTGKLNSWARGFSWQRSNL